MYVETFDYTAPLSAWTYQGLDALFGRSRVVHWVVSGGFLFFQAFFFNRTLLTNKVLSELNYLPAFLYVVFSVAIFDFFGLSPQLMSLTWVVISMDHLIRRMDNEAKDELFLVPGFYLGIAGLFYFPSTVFFLVFLLAIIIIVRAKLRRVLLYIYGWLTANLIVWTILYISGSWGEFWNVYFIELFRAKTYYVSITQMLTWSLFPILIFIISLVRSLGTREGSLHAKTQQFMVLILIAALGAIAIGGTFSGVDLVFLIPVFTFFLTNYFIKLKKRIWKILIPNLMIIGSLGAPFLGIWQDLIDPDLLVGKPDSSVSDKKVMVLGPLDPLYLNNQMVSPVIDRRLGRERLSDLDYYHRSMVFLEIFEKSNPDVIFDDWGAMPEISHRFPQIEQMEIPVVNR